MSFVVVEQEFSLFPHSASPPCFLKRATEQERTVGIRLNLFQDYKYTRGCLIFIRGPDAQFQHVSKASQELTPSIDNVFCVEYTCFNISRPITPLMCQKYVDWKIICDETSWSGGERTEFLEEFLENTDLAVFPWEQLLNSLTRSLLHRKVCNDAEFWLKGQPYGKFY